MKRLFVAVFLALITLCGCYYVTDDVNSALSVHFIDVGQADATLLISQGEAMLIDGGNVEDSRVIYSYLTDYNVRNIDYIIATHPHEDHVGGLTAALERADVGRIYLPEAESDEDFYKKFLEKAEDKGVEMVHPEDGESFSLGECQVTLYVPEDREAENLNNTSIVTRVVCGEKSFLFTGDAEREVEEELLSRGVELESTVLKAPHHGSDSSSTYPFLREVMPEIIVISSGKDNSYGHPHKEVLSRYNDLGAEIYRTDESGHIVINTDGVNINVNTAKKKGNKPQDAETSEPSEYSYIGNLGSKKLHLPTCGNLPKSENRVYFQSRNDAIDLGFTPCGGCNP